MLGKSASNPELDGLRSELFGHSEGHFYSNPDELLAAHPSSSLPPSGPTDVSMGVEHPLLSIPKELSTVSRPGHAPPSPGGESNNLRVNLFGQPKSNFVANPGQSSITSSSKPSGPADVSTAVKQPLPSIPNEPSPVFNPDFASSSPINERWLNLFGQPGSYILAKPEELIAAHSSWRSLQSWSPNAWMGAKGVKPLRPILPKVPSLVSNPGHASPSSGAGSTKAEELIAAHSSWRSLQSSPPNARMRAKGVKRLRPILPKVPSLVSNPGHASPSSGAGSKKQRPDPFQLGGYFPAKQDESLAASRPSSSLQQSKPADGWTDVRKPLPPIPEEPSPVSSPDQVSPSRSDKLNEALLNIFGRSEDHSFAKPEGSSAAAAHLSSSSQQSGADNGWTDAMQLLPSINQDLPPVSSPDHEPPTQDH